MITYQLIGLIVFAFIAMVDLGSKSEDSDSLDLNMNFLAIIIVGLFIAAGVTFGTMVVWHPFVEYLQSY